MPRSRAPRRRQVAAVRAQVRLLRHVLDTNGATAASAAVALQMSAPNLSLLISRFTSSGIIVARERRQTGRRGPWSRVLSLSPRAGCSIGIDIEATRLRAVVVDFANDVRIERRRSIAATARPDDIVRSAAELAREMVRGAKRKRLSPCAIGLGLPGPVRDIERGQIETELQFGKATLEFVPAMRAACGVPVLAASNTYCFALAHHRSRFPIPSGIEMVVLVRFGIGVAILSDGRLYGEFSRAGDLGLLRSAVTAPGRRYVDLCTGSALLRLERRHSHKGRRTLSDLMEPPYSRVVHRWLETALPAFAEAVFTSIVLYDPDRTIIEGLLNLLRKERRDEIVDRVHRELDRVRMPRKPLTFFEGDDLMGARGAALLARDRVVTPILEDLARSVSAGHRRGMERTR